MNVLFLCLSRVWDVNEKGIYSDLLREFIKNGDFVYVVSPVERRYREKTQLIDQGNAKILKVKTLNIQKTSLMEKGLGTVLLERQFLAAIKKYYHNIVFDLVLYTTPPITLVKPIRYIKKRDNAKTYLLLKDIFPQNAVDLGMMRTSGLKGVLYKVFRKKERQLYAVSDRIGCMSQANADYVIAHNSEVDPAMVEVSPNCIEVIDKSVKDEVRGNIRAKYGIPFDKKVFVYGGNLGKPQGIPFLTECLNKCRDMEEAFFLVVGDGTEYRLLEEYVQDSGQRNLKLMKSLPKEDFDTMVGACDVGLIFLDHRFTIPNFPSRLLAYMQAKLPVLACTDPNTDIGKVITEGGFGWWCESDDADGFYDCAKRALQDDAARMKEKAWEYLLENYSVEKGYEIIVRKILNESFKDQQCVGDLQFR